MNQPVVGVTLATVASPPDAGAAARLKSIIAEVVASGRPLPTRQVFQDLSQADRGRLIAQMHNLTNVDDVVFFELN